MGLLLEVAIAAPVVGAAAGVGFVEWAWVAVRVAAGAAAGCWFALVLHGSVVSVSHLHASPLVAAAGCGAALIVVNLDVAAVERPVWASVALAAVSVALAAGHTATDGRGVVVGVGVAVAAAALAAATVGGRPPLRAWGPAAAAAGLVAAAAGVVALRSATNSWQLPLPLADMAASHRGAGLLIIGGAALVVLAGSQRARAPSAVLVPAGAFLAVQAAPIASGADGLAPVAIVLAVVAVVAAAAALVDRPPVCAPAAAITLLALAAVVGPGATRGPALLLAAAGTLAATVGWDAAAALGVPGGVALAIALAERGGATAFVIGAFAGVVALVLAVAAARRERAAARRGTGLAERRERATARRRGAVVRPPIWSIPALALGAWLVVAPDTWAWVGPAGLRAYDVGAARAVAGAALCLVTLVLLGREPGGWYARAFPTDSPGEDVVRH
ncbi:MAG: hypothetical protein JOZ04_01695 [Acidimicrobiia bacterium]|nr:hypothetical protein [Acidimicrobiia bacterium]